MFCKLAAISLNLRVLVASRCVDAREDIEDHSLAGNVFIADVFECAGCQRKLWQRFARLGSLPLTETGLPPKVTVEPVFLTDFFAVFLTDFFFAFFAVFFFDAMVSPGHVVFGRPLRADCNVDAIKSAPTTHHW